MNLNAYLQRINYHGDVLPTKEVLFNIQKTHLLNVPFENLDIHMNREIRLDYQRIFDKVVGNNRGGFCYELNGLFHELLTLVGYEVKRISARVYSEEKGFGPEYDHLTNLVTVNGKKYLVEVGYGEFAFYPLEFVLGKPQKDPRGEFVFEKYDDDYFIVQKTVDGKLKPEYIFTTAEREFAEYAPMCHYMQTSPDSHFVQKRLCTIPSEDGRVTMTGDIMKIRKGDRAEEHPIKDDNHFRELLSQYFNMHLK